MNLSEQIAATQQSQIGIALSVAEISLGAVEKIATLNMQAIKATLSEHKVLTDRAVATHEVSELLELQTGYMQALPLKAKAYWEHVANILVEAQHGATATAEEHLEKYRANAQSFLASVSTTPFQANADVSPWKSAFVATGNAASDTAQQITGSALNMVEEGTSPVIIASDGPTSH